MSRKEKLIESPVIETIDGVSFGSNLIIFNDEVNTFGHVIECLVRICKHESIQAEQSAVIIHYKGKAIVKTGDRGELAAMCQALCDEGLSATIGE